jgi:zinc protease
MADNSSKNEELINMRNLRMLYAVFCFLFFNSTFAQTIPLDTAVHTGVLPNGFTYYIRHNEEPKNRVFLYLVNNVGSVLEDSSQQGLAHFMEHMNFNGTTHFPKNELVSYLQKSGVRFGADLNAYTGFDETVYQLPLPADDASILQNGFQIMRDWAQNATLDSIEIDKERGVVLEEERLGRGASERMERVYFPVLLNQSRYAERLPIGKVDILNNFPPSAIRRFHADWYRPNLQALVVVGDIDPEKTEALVKQLFSDLKNPAGERARTKYTVPLTGQNHFLQVTDKEMPQTVLQVMIKHKDEKLITEENYIHSMQRDLFNQMIAERFAAFAQTPNLPYLEAGADINGFLGGLDAFSLEIALKQGKFKEGFQAAWALVEKVKRFGFTQTELERAQQNYLSSLETAFREKNKTGSESFVGEYQRHFLNQEASPGITWEYNFAKNHVGDITLEQINAIVKEYIRDQDRDILILAPEKDKNTLPDSSTVSSWINGVSQEKLTAFMDEVNKKPLLSSTPVPGKVIDNKPIASIGVSVLTLSNGIRVILKSTDFKNDEIRFAAFSPGGTSLYSDVNYVNAANAGIIAGFGVGTFNPVQLDKILTGRILEVTPYIGERTEGFQGYSTPKDFETALQLLYLRFTSPRKDTDLYNNIINNAREELINRYSDPKNVFTDTVNRILGNYNYRRQPFSENRLNQLNLDKLYKIYRERFSDASGFTFVFVGNFKIDSMRPLLEKYLGSLPALHKKETARDLGIHIPTGQITRKVFKGSENKATVKMVFSGDYIFSAENNMTLQAIKEVLEIKITQHLREDESEVYSPSVQVSYSKYPRARFSFTIAFGCAPANADHLMKSVVKEMDTLKKNGPTLEDLDKFKAEYKRVHELQIRENQSWLDYLLSQFENHDDPTLTLSYNQRLNNLTPGIVQKAAQTYLSGVNDLRFELLPEQTTK